MNLDGLRRELARAGLNVTGGLNPEPYDALVPDAWRTERVDPGSRGVLIVGNGGRALWPIFEAAPEAALRRDPLDRYTERVLRDLSTRFTPPLVFALYTERRAEHYLPLVSLAERAGLGTPGRMGLLLHPTYGPWLAIRAALYVPFALPPPTPGRFEPCVGCPAPCATHCRGGAVGESFDARACLRSKLPDGPCRASCDARSACIAGREHAYTAEQSAHHARIRWSPPLRRQAARALASPPKG
jgi:hypothetical protein